MIELKLKDKIRLVIAARKDISKNGNEFMCLAIGDAFDKEYDLDDYPKPQDIMKMFPELAEFKPEGLKGDSGPWFSFDNENASIESKREQNSEFRKRRIEILDNLLYNLNEKLK